MDDAVARSDQLDQEILAIPRDRVFTKRAVVAGFVVLLVPLLAVLTLVVGITHDTNRAVERQVLPLQKRNAELEKTNAQLEDVNGQAVDWIVKLSQLLKEHGVEPPEIVIRPTTTTQPED